MDMPKSQVTLPSSRWDILWYLLAGYVLYVALITAFTATGVISTQVWIILQPALLLICLFGATWLVGERRRRFTWADLGLIPFRWQRAWLRWVIVASVLLTLYSLLMALLITWIRHGNISGLADIGAPLGLAAWSNLALLWLGTAFLAPLAEEIFFRGAVYAWFEQRFGPWPAIVGSAAMFAITRATFFDTSSPFSALQSLGLGLVLAWLMRKTRSLWVPIAVHILVRSLSLFVPMFLGSWF
ncbi:MAG: CPBP family intramembrane glutamic endopeptidase [Chloroflexota bacterium]